MQKKLWVVYWRSCYIVATCWNLLSKYDNFRKKKSLKFGDFGVFFSKKYLGMSCNGFF